MIRIKDLNLPVSPIGRQTCFNVLMFIIPADECLHAVRALTIPQCYALTPPLFFLFNQPRSSTRPTPPPLLE